MEDPARRVEWMEAKKNLLEEIDVVKELEVEIRGFKDVSIRSSSPPIRSSGNKSSFAFQPLYEYPTSSSGGGCGGNNSFDDPDIWKPPARERRPGSKPGQALVKKNDAKYARGAGQRTTPGLGAKSIPTRGGYGSSTPAVKSSAKKGKPSNSSAKSDITVSYLNSCIGPF